MVLRSHSIKFLSMAVLGISVFAVSVNAKKQSVSTIKTVELPKFDEETAFKDFLSDADFEKLKSKAQERAKRSPASDEVDPNNPAYAGFMRLRDRILKIETPLQIHELLNDLDRKERWTTGHAEELSTSEKYLAAKLIPMRSFRGIASRLKPVYKFGPSTNVEPKILHSFIVTALKQMAVSGDILANTAEWKAMFRYLTEPYSSDPALHIGNENELQVFVSKELLPSLNTAMGRITKLSFATQVGIFDNQLFYGDASFQDGISRYVTVDEAERLARLSQLHFNISHLYAQNAFTWTGSIKASEQLGKLYGIDGFFGSEITGASSFERTKIIRSFANLGRMRTDGTEAQNNLTFAWSNFKQGARLLILVQKELDKKAPARLEQLLRNMDTPRTSYFEPGLTAFNHKATKMAVSDFEALINGPTYITSGVTGKKVKVDLAAAYDAKRLPETLQDFLPDHTNTNPADKKIVKLPDSNGRMNDVTYRDYWAGRPTQWKISTYQKIFPEVTNANLLETRRTLAMSHGAAFMASPMALFTE